MSSSLSGQRLTDKLNELSHVADSLGKPIDPGILRTVALLQLSGFPTLASCEGHINWGTPNPWVDIGTRCPPDVEQWYGETAIKTSLMQQLGITQTDISPGPHRNPAKHRAFHARFVEWRETTKPEQTQAYVDWQVSNNLLLLRLTKLIRRFEGTREAEPLIVLEINKRLTLWDTFSKHDHVTNQHIDPSTPEAQHLTARLLTRQQRMATFTDFLMVQLKYAAI